MSWWETAQVGDKVVCIRAYPASFSDGRNRVDNVKLLELNRIYKITEFVRPEELVPSAANTMHINVGIMLKGKETAFPVKLFRPLESRPTSIEVFHRILRKHSEPVDA